ncbi:hypothetical protein Ahy_A07g033968 isoform B [Arachis hypogaea]|uniref:Uncharacterized protein n=1 Tax=Arachis hypogaea TaxID=3818 RepID=A0A445CAV9_ARAHY|nr:hypothetical protein Ahy_A07g033968 isoform A [Arachis hypogaea]RYR47984.1 hypothetical protein Ahy_A07g033968 isoform B [Arachis hypogaea]
MSANKALISMDAPSSAVKIFPTSNPLTPSSANNQENAERSIALFFFENKLDFSVARSSSYQLMIDAIAKCGPGFTDMRRDITNQIYTFTKAHGMFGCSLAKEARSTVAPLLDPVIVGSQGLNYCDLYAEAASMLCFPV